MKYALGLSLFVFAACGADSFPAGDARLPGDESPTAPGQCSPSVLCFSGCSVAHPGCLTGTLDTAACACLDAAGGAQSWPSPNALPQSMFFALPVPRSPARDEPFDVGVRVRFDDGTVRSATREATYSVSPADALEFRAPGVALAHGKGKATLTVTWNGLSVEAELDLRPIEARAVWMTRFDWTTREELVQRINDAADAGFNVVFFQVRGNGDAFYDSTLEPWAARLGGALGKDPRWDPLQDAIDAAHARGLELHAYVNAFTGWVGAAEPPASPPGAPTHVLRKNPSWRERTNGNVFVDEDNYQWLSPAVEGVRAWNTAVVQDIATRYAVDGIHLDRIRYANKDFGWNDLGRTAFQASGKSDFNAFRVEAVNAQVRDIHRMLRNERPDIPLSAAVWGIHTRLPGCTTSEGKNGYFQDSWAWAQSGYIDVLVPMIYWAEGDGCTGWGRLYQTFLDHRGGAAVWGGMNVLDGGRLDLAALTLRITTARGMNAPGVALYASKQLADQGAWQPLREKAFGDPAFPPPFP